VRRLLKRAPPEGLLIVGLQSEIVPFSDAPTSAADVEPPKGLAGLAEMLSGIF
jgi:hypothetical protein